MFSNRVFLISRVMEVFLVLLVYAGYGASALDIQDILNIPSDLWNKTEWLVPGADFNNTWVSKDSVMKEMSSMLQDKLNIDFDLYTKQNRDTKQKLKTNDVNSLNKSNFNGANPTRFIVHGFQSTANDLLCTELRDALLKRGSFNVICVDWSEISMKLYPTARFSVSLIGKAVAEFIEYLMKQGEIPLDHFTLMGHSLGAHVVGFAGKDLGSKLPHIIGLDPALPLFNYSDCSSRLCKTDAKFVESVHSCGGRLGILRPIGVLNFYANGGAVQPGCGLDLYGSCSHARSYMYYAEAIEKDDFPTMNCTTFISATLGNCGNSYSSVRMAAPSSYGVTGLYYVPVNSEPQYGKGKPMNT